MTPALSIVVPTHDRAGRLDGLVDALAQLRVPDDGVEVVFVDDASSDETASRLAALAEHRALAAAVLRNDRNLGPAASRNVGWRTATGGLIAFLDDDCRPEPGWAVAVVDALRTADVVQGRTVPDPSPRRGPFSHTIAIERFTGRYETCNIAYRREVLEGTGGFDESFRVPYGEDIDLGWRAAAAGARATFSAAATVVHDVERSSVRDRLRRAGRVGAMAAVVRRHPGYRRHLHAGVFTDRSHLWAVVAATGVASAVASRRPILASAVVGYVGHRLASAPLWNRWKSPVTVPAALVIDLREVAALARASWRERTLVL